MTEKEFRCHKWKEGEVFYTIGFHFFEGYMPIPDKVIRVRVVRHQSSSKYILLLNCNKKYNNINIFRLIWINTRKKYKLYDGLCSYKDGFAPNEYLYKTKQEALAKFESDKQEFIEKGIQRVVSASNYSIKEAKKTIKYCRSIFRMKIFQQAKKQ